MILVIVAWAILIGGLVAFIWPSRDPLERLYRLPACDEGDRVGGQS